MFEITINENVFSFRFGMGFLMECNKRYKVPVEGLKDVTKEVGLQLMLGDLIDGDPVALCDILDAANKTEKPRVTKQLLYSYIEDENTDIDKLFEDVLDFLRNANVTKKLVKTVETTLEEERSKLKARQV